jgi:hypothetical protein
VHFFDTFFRSWRSLGDALRIRAEQLAKEDQEQSYKLFEETKDILHKLLDKHPDDVDILNDLALACIRSHSETDN